MRILVVGGGLQALSCGESLCKKHTVSIVTSDLMCRKSRFFQKVYADVKADDSLMALLEKECFDVLIPVSDMTLPFICKNKTRIEDIYGVKCACPSVELVRIVGDKHLFMSFCSENGIPHPKTAQIKDDLINDVATTVGFPSLIKPDFSVGARGITRVDSLDELKKKYPTVSNQYGSCTLQELIENEEYYYNVMLYRDKDGCFPAYAISKIVRMYPIHAGSSSCLVTVENDTLLNICKGCLEKLNWVGMADFDVLQRLDSGEYRIIEINARVPASLRAAMISKVNFPEIIVSDALGLKAPQYTYQPGKVLRYLGIDILWLLKSPRRFKTYPNWFHLCGENVFYQDLYKHDPSTWWTWLAEGIVKLTKRSKRLR